MSILPHSILKLWRGDFDLPQDHAIVGGDWANNDVDPRIQAEYQCSMRTIKHEVAASEEDLARRRNGYRIVDHWTSP